MASAQAGDDAHPLQDAAGPGNRTPDNGTPAGHAGENNAIFTLQMTEKSIESLEVATPLTVRESSSAELVPS